jgi:hypothetical protein
MSSLRQRKSPPQVSPAVEVIDLLRELVELQRQTAGDTAAIKAMMEAAQPPPANRTDTAPLIDQADLLTPKQSTAFAKRDVTTVRRWCREYEIGIEIGGTLFVSKEKLLAHLAKHHAD